MADSTYLEHALYIVASQACDLAMENARFDLKTLRGGRECFYPIVRGQSIGVGFNPEYHYLVYQENGFASFPMKALLGKTIPLMIGGRIVFRKCTNINQFRPGHKNYWQRDKDGNLVPEYKQARSWVHPGMPPKHFVKDAIKEAMEDNRQFIDDALLYDVYENLEEQYGE